MPAPPRPAKFSFLLLVTVLALSAWGSDVGAAESQSSTTVSGWEAEIRRLENILTLGDRDVQETGKRYRDEHQRGIELAEEAVRRAELHLMQRRTELANARGDMKNTARERVQDAERSVAICQQTHTNAVNKPVPRAVFFGRDDFVSQLRQARAQLASAQAEELQLRIRKPAPAATHGAPQSVAPPSPEDPAPRANRRPSEANSPAPAPRAADSADTPATGGGRTAPPKMAGAVAGPDLAGAALADLLAGFPLRTGSLPGGAKRTARDVAQLSPIDRALWAAVEARARAFSQAGGRAVPRAEVEGLLTDARGFLAESPDFFAGWVLQARLAIALDRAAEGIAASINLEQLGASASPADAIGATMRQLRDRGW